MKKPGLPNHGISPQFLNYVPLNKRNVIHIESENKKQDFSHRSDYWKDKKYSHVAPDGTVHPQRYADRRKEQAEYERKHK
jgi:hypothetical protein